MCSCRDLTCQVRRAKQSDGILLQTITVTVHRGEKRLGMMLDDANVVLEIKPNSPANGLLLTGDRVLALDNVELADRRLAQVLQPRPTHIFKVCRHVEMCPLLSCPHQLFDERTDLTSFPSSSQPSATTLTACSLMAWRS